MKINFVSGKHEIAVGDKVRYGYANCLGEIVAVDDANVFPEQSTVGLTVRLKNGHKKTVVGKDIYKQINGVK